MRKTFELGKVDYLNHNRKDCAVEVEIELREKDNKVVFSSYGRVWNARHTDIYCGGQCLDEIKGLLPDNETFNKIYRLWKLYHLNDMHSGTPSQEKAIREWESCGNDYDYNKACEYLKSINLYEDNGYRYGSGWLYEPIPEDDLNLIKELLEA